MPTKFFYLCLLLCFNAFVIQGLSRAQTPSLEASDYEKLRQQYQLPGLSIAVVDNYQLVFSQSFGKKDFASSENIDQHTAFNGASISKPVVATLAVMLAEQGILNLDTPVSTYLKSWKLPESDFKQAITLRHLLTHTAGTSHSGYKSRYLGQDIPDIAETLDSYKDAAIEVLSEPGSNWKYSGGGFLIAQLVMQDATGKSLPQLANDMLFEPLVMQNSSFYQHGSKGFPANTAKAHDNQQQVIETGLPICPQAACGLWTNANDMALLAIEIQKALSGQATKVISGKVAKTLMAVQTTQLSGGWGLGWARSQTLANLDWFSHEGYNHGTGALVMASTQGGRGIFIFANGAYQVRIPVMKEILADVSLKLNWKQSIQASSKQPTPKLLAQVAGQYHNLTPHFFSPFAKQISIKQQGQKLVLVNGINKTHDLLHMGNNKFRADELVNSLLGFRFAPDGKIYLTLEHKEQALSSDALVKTP